MASVDKVKVGDTTYDVSLGASGTLNGFTSSDNVTPPDWSDVSTVSSGDTNSTIFSKLTTMVKNVRWLYNKLGTVDISSTGSNTISGGISAVQNNIDGKANASHTHGVRDLPVSNSSVNSTSYVPSSAVVYGLQSTMESLSSEVMDIAVIVDPPNERYESKSLGTWSSVSDVEAFLTTYTHENNYTGLKLGNYVTIQDGTYNAQWEIAGFDTEYNQTAASGTVYNNGYGICLIPKTQVTTGQWNTYDTTSGGYKSSYMHTTVLPNIVTTLRNVLGDHIVNRNVLLSSSTSSSTGSSNGYAWTTADATLMPMGQMSGYFDYDSEQYAKYNDGEAMYRLPLFNYEKITTGSRFWVRNIYGMSKAYYIDGSDVYSFDGANASNAYGIRPLIYLRRNATNEPNNRYAPRDLGTWSSVDQVTEFLSKYTHKNWYYDSETDTKLGLGDYVTIQDGTYNVIWEIAGFDTEYNRTASDGTVYDNGYGICLIPKTQVTTEKWNSSTVGYKSSYVHTTVLPGIVNTLKNVLGDHIVNRNVLLSSSVATSPYKGPNAHTWTTAYATLMSGGQMDGVIESKYNDGEANYKLPVFNYENYYTGSNFWIRDITTSGTTPIYINSTGVFYTGTVSKIYGIRPLIYIR